MATEREIELSYIAWATGLVWGHLVSLGAKVEGQRNEEQWADEMVVDIQGQRVRIKVLGPEPDPPF